MMNGHPALIKDKIMRKEKPVKWNIVNPANPSQDCESDTCVYCRKGFTSHDVVTVVNWERDEMAHEACISTNRGESCIAEN